MTVPYSANNAESVLIIVFISVLWSYATGAVAGYKTGTSGLYASAKYGLSLLNDLNLSDPSEFAVNQSYQRPADFTATHAKQYFGREENVRSGDCSDGCNGILFCANRTYG